MIQEGIIYSLFHEDDIFNVNTKSEVLKKLDKRKMRLVKDLRNDGWGILSDDDPNEAVPSTKLKKFQIGDGIYLIGRIEGHKVYTIRTVGVYKKGNDMTRKLEEFLSDYKVK